MDKKEKIGINPGILWDVDLENFDPANHQEFLAERIATKGKLSDIKWFIDNYGFQKFLDSILDSRACPENIKHFWKDFKRNQLV